ncbi:nucleoside 2-deoxyribosyltransferase [Bacteroidota bacterium]
MMIRIYFAGSIRGGREMAHAYQELIQMLQSFGQVFTEHIGDENAINLDFENLSDKQIHDRDLEWIRSSDMMIAEVSVPSLGVGYEIARAIELGKPVLGLYRKNSRHRLSAMISGCMEVRVMEYESLGMARNLIEQYVSEYNE